MFATIKNDKKLQLLLFFCFLVQLYFSYTQVGFFHPDQHFQILEFSSHYLGENSYATSIWELDAKIRPTLQIFIFNGFKQFCNAINIKDGFTIVSLIQMISGVLMFLLFNAMALFYFKNESKKILYWVIVMMNLSFSFAFVRTLYSSETFGALFFFSGLFYFHKSPFKSFTISIITGILLCLAFYARFQMAFAIAGFGVWLLFFEKCYKQIFWIALGFVLALAFNIYLDKLFYNEWLFTPYNYYKVNIVEGKASSFGTSSFINYILILAAVVFAPFYSLVLFGVGIKSVIKNYKHPIILSVVLFVFGHCLVAHKEERFLYPIFCALPLVIGFELNNFFNYFNNTKGFTKKILAFSKWFGLVFNSFLLILFLFISYCQVVYFAELVHKKFPTQKTEIYYTEKHFLETPNHLQLQFYKNSMTNVQLNKINSFDTLKYMSNVKFFISAFNQLDNAKNKTLDSLGFKPTLSSSKLLWKIDEFLYSKNIGTINDIWMLYER